MNNGTANGIALHIPSTMPRERSFFLHPHEGRNNDHLASSPHLAFVETPPIENAAQHFQHQYTIYRDSVEAMLSSLVDKPVPASLYDPMRYILGIGGKRVRPVLAMIAAAAVGGNPHDALFGGIAVEILHNFTLIHDDIMDAAPTRRNMQTVHVKWNESAAILSGDGMMAVAYQVMMRSANLSRLRELVDAMNTGILEVCEGQAYDLEFQDRSYVALDEYFMMIEKKTAKMLELSVRAGGILGNGSQAHIDALAKYALAIGIAFQVQDDLLDISATDAAKLGKTIGGDIIEGKKTYLIARALEKRPTFNDRDQALLDEFIRNHGLPEERVPEMQDVFERNGIFASAKNEVERLTSDAHKALSVLPDNAGRSMLHQFALMLLERSH
ncbi:MAG: polyprenyl synthetase family protein [Candidatus Kapaibacterium sp.]|nr:MAG: polyprenyl synthetase family protein [Candidatus Kapabacteria bacterium]